MEEKNSVVEFNGDGYDLATEDGYALAMLAWGKAAKALEEFGSAITKRAVEKGESQKVGSVQVKFYQPGRSFLNEEAVEAARNKAEETGDEAMVDAISSAIQDNTTTSVKWAQVVKILELEPGFVVTSEARATIGLKK